MRSGLFVLTFTSTITVAAAADPQSFVGTWQTTYGRMTLIEERGTLSGTYGGRNGITGKQQGGKFTFTYFEPSVTGEGEFELAADGQSFSGRWRPNGRPNWSNWTGRRVSDDPTDQSGSPWSNSPPPNSRWPNSPPQEEPDEPKPVVYRYGHLPDGLPPYFTDGDFDKDGQVGLYEWVNYWDPDGAGLSAGKIDEYKDLDLNRDGLLTAEEYLRALKANAPATPTPTTPPSQTPTSASGSRWPRPGPSR